MKAFTPPPPGMPAPRDSSKIRSRKVVLDISSSYQPGRFTRPESANSRVPVEEPSPSAANASPAVLHDPGQIRDGLDVVHYRRFVVEAHDGGESSAA